MPDPFGQRGPDREVAVGGAGTVRVISLQMGKVP